MAKTATAAAPAVKTTKTSGTVTVACKFPAGVVLQLCQKVEFEERTQAGGTVKRIRYDKVGQVFTARGPADPNGQAPKGFRRPEVEGGYALTSGIPADFWEEWLSQNAQNPLVLSKMIFAHVSKDSTIDEAQDHESTRSGFEPLNPDGTGKDRDSRIPRSLDPSVSNIETADERKGRAPAPAVA